jgi:hypothetical protein
MYFQLFDVQYRVIILVFHSMLCFSVVRSVGWGPDCWGLGRVLPHNGVFLVFIWLGLLVKAVIVAICGRCSEPHGKMSLPEDLLRPFHPHFGCTQWVLDLDPFFGRAM